jgi:hypothetical protein
MYDAAVVPCLMSTKIIFGFENDKAKARLCIKERICDGYTDDASADDRDIVLVITHGVDSNSTPSKAALNVGQWVKAYTR